MKLLKFLSDICGALLEFLTGSIKAHHSEGGELAWFELPNLIFSVSKMKKILSKSPHVQEVKRGEKFLGLTWKTDDRLQFKYKGIGYRVTEMYGDSDAYDVVPESGYQHSLPETAELLELFKTNASIFSPVGSGLRFIMIAFYSCLALIPIFAGVVSIFWGDNPFAQVNIFTVVVSVSIWIFLTLQLIPDSLAESRWNTFKYLYLAGTLILAGLTVYAGLNSCSNARHQVDQIYLYHFGLITIFTLSRMTGIHIKKAQALSA